MVELKRLFLENLLGDIEVEGSEGPIQIPDYQRTYCWPEKNVILLMEDLLIKKHNHSYHLGTIILQYSENGSSKGWDIIDGQQRMVTLSLILEELGDKSPLLLNEKFLSKRANDFIAYNKYLINVFIDRLDWDDNTRSKKLDEIKSNISLDVLFLQDESLDLAYTFFSAQNDRGKPLTDYELLKSHHLRYIPWEPQQMHLAQKWDRLLLDHESEKGDRSVSIVVGFYLYCLRKWSGMDECDPYGDKAIKNEFEAAPIMDEVPPFGEAFHFKEAIQGGSHFFAYVEHFVRRFISFQQTIAYQVLWDTISCSGKIIPPKFDKDNSLETIEKKERTNKKRTHWWYGDVIAAFLFAYYIKFGEEYLAEALTCITRVISQFRYGTSKANKDRLLQLAGESRIITLLERSTSPTFFLAELRNRIQLMPATKKSFLSEKKNNETIRDDYKKLEIKLYDKISKSYVISIKHLHNK